MSDHTPSPPVPAGVGRDAVAARSRAGRSRLPAAALIVFPGSLALLVAATFIARTDGVPLVDLLRDTTATLDAPFHIGLVSNVGILLWGACTTICLFTAVVLGRSPRAATGVAPPGRGFFLGAGGVSAWLLADDALLLHEQVFPDYLGLPGELSLAIGFGATAAFLVAFRRALLAGDYPILCAALLLLGGSAVIDRLHDLDLIGALVLHSDALETLLEDSLKLAGIGFWLTHFALAARDALTLRAAPSPSS